jgi:hypothetical protein
VKLATEFEKPEVGAPWMNAVADASQIIHQCFG